MSASRREMRPSFLCLALLVAGCAMFRGAGDPLPPPQIEDARALLDEIIEAGLDRDWQRLCASASGTCEAELADVQDRAPVEPPVVIAASVHQPIVRDESWTSGGVLFTLCGIDGLGDGYESEVLVFNGGTRLMATAAVYWTGTQVHIAAPGEAVTVGGEAEAEQRCP